MKNLAASHEYRERKGALRFAPCVFNIITLLLLSLSALLWNGVWFVFAEEDSAQDPYEDLCDTYRYNGDQLMSEIFEAASINTNFQIADMFGGNSEEPEIENLYLNIYKMVDQEPADEALKKTAEAYQYTQTEMCAILAGSLAPLTDMQEATLSISEALEIRSEILQTYLDEFESAKRTQEMFLDSYGKEVFANGDTSDSSFDLLYDLEILEYLLFGEDSYEVTGGGSLDFDSDDEDAEDGETPSSDESTTEDEEEEPTEDGEEGEEPTDETASETDTEEAEAAEEETVNPAACEAGDVLQEAFQEVIEEETDTEEPGSDDSSDSDGDSDDSSGSTGDSSADGNDEDEKDDDDDLPIASEPHDWTTPQVCDGIFCLFINFKNYDETNYEKTSNCVQCHVDYLLETLRETTSHNLTAGKVSGNLMEPAICKESLAEALTRPGLSFIAIPMPIQTPPNDDVVIKVDLCDAMSNFVGDEENYDLLSNALFKEKCGEDAEVADTLTDEERAALRDFGDDLNDQISAAIMRADEAVSVEEILEEALGAHQQDLDALEVSFRLSYIQAQFSSQATFYQALEYEMSQMVAYFQTYYDLIVQTQEVAKELQTRLAKTK